MCFLKSSSVKKINKSFDHKESIHMLLYTHTQRCIHKLSLFFFFPPMPFPLHFWAAAFTPCTFSILAPPLPFSLSLTLFPNPQFPWEFLPIGPTALLYLSRPLSLSPSLSELESLEDKTLDAIVFSFFENVVRKIKNYIMLVTLTPLNTFIPPITHAHTHTHVRTFHHWCTKLPLCIWVCVCVWILHAYVDVYIGPPSRGQWGVFTTRTIVA